MSVALKLLAMYQEKGAHASDSETARALRVKPSAVNNWRHGRSRPDPTSVYAMCEQLGEPVQKWLALIEAERATTQAAKRVWMKVASAAVILLAIGTLPIAHSAPDSLSHNPGSQCILCKLVRLAIKRWHALCMRLRQAKEVRHGTTTRTAALAV